jgi:hypothetical protein
MTGAAKAANNCMARVTTRAAMFLSVPALARLDLS